MKHFYVTDEYNQQKGPFTAEELKGKGISQESMVWTEGLENWVQAKDISELRAILITPPTPPSFYSSGQPIHSSVAATRPKLTVIKVFSIIGLLGSLLLIFIAFGLGNLRAYSFGTECDCQVSGNGDMAIITMFLALFFLTFSVIGLVKSFQK